MSTIISDVHKLKQNKIYQRIVLVNPDCKPEYATTHSACMDCKANIAEPVTIQPHQTVLIPLGFKLDLSYGTKAMLYPRSGLAVKHSITLQNAVGTGDVDFVNEYCAILHNDGLEPFTVEPLMKVCQLDIVRYNRIKLVEVDTIRDKSEVHNGFGSTGISVNDTK